MELKNIGFLILLVITAGLISSCEEMDRAGRPFSFRNDSVIDPGPDEGIDEEGVLPKRPENAVFIQAGSCACRSGKPIIMGNCAALCASKPNNPNEILYMTVKITEAIELSDLKDLNGWCTTELIDPLTGEPIAGQGNPGCVIEAKDDNNLVKNIAFTATAGSKNLSIDISNQLDDNKNYRLSIVETSSGARSNTVQAYKYSENPNPSMPGPLKLYPITQYTCFSRVTTQDDNNGNLYFDDAYRLHFYFDPENRPDPIPRSLGNLFCHDIFYYGLTDNEFYPRLEETANAITLWNKKDPRFYDLSGSETGGPNGEMDIHDILKNKVEDQGFNIDGELKLFHEFKWPGAPTLETEAGGGNSADLPLGYYMVPWIDKTTYYSYCPTEAHYSSNNELFVAMRDVLGVGTEALYIAKKEAQSILNEDGEYDLAPEDYILIRESNVKNIWFYIQNGQAIAPTTESIDGKKIQFYWPADESSPYIKKSHQRIYTIRSATELQASGSNIDDNGSSNTGGTSTNYPPHDKRIGCIPLASGT